MYEIHKGAQFQRGGAESSLTWVIASGGVEGIDIFAILLTLHTLPVQTLLCIEKIVLFIILTYAGNEWFQSSAKICLDFYQIRPKYPALVFLLLRNLAHLWAAHK